MLTTHERDNLRKELTDVLGLPAGSSEKNGRFIAFWNENNTSLDIIVQPNGEITIYACSIKQFDMKIAKPDEVIQYAKQFKEEMLCN